MAVSVVLVILAVSMAVVLYGPYSSSTASASRLGRDGDGARRNGACLDLFSTPTATTGAPAAPADRGPLKRR